MDIGRRLATVLVTMIVLVAKCSTEVLRGNVQYLLALSKLHGTASTKTHRKKTKKKTGRKTCCE